MTTAQALSLVDRARQTERSVGNGIRWGTRVRYEVEAATTTPQERIRKMAVRAERGALLVDGSALCRFEVPQNLEGSTQFVTEEGFPLPVLFLSGAEMVTLAAQGEGRNLAELLFWAANHLSLAAVAVNAFCSRISNIFTFLDLNREILSRAELITFPSSLDEGEIHGGRRLRISESAVLRGPLLMGDEVYIRKDAEIGPNALIGDRSLIDEGARVANSVIGPDTYIGCNTSFEYQYVSGDYCVDLNNQAAIYIDDPVIIADLTKGAEWHFLSRLVAGLLGMASLPLLLLLLPVHRLLRGRWMCVGKILKQPLQRNLKNEYELKWQKWHRFEFGLFLLDVIPSLWDICSGRLSFVGNPPLGEQELKQIDDSLGDWLHGKAGCTGPAQQLDCESLSPTEVFEATVQYNATRSFAGDVRLFLRALIPGVHQGKRKGP